MDAESGAPLHGVAVSVYATERSDHSAVTDRDGRYEIRGLSPGRYRVGARTDGYLTLDYGQTRPSQGGRPVILADKQVIDNVNFNLPRGGAIAGVVRDESGDPVPNVQVRALSPTYSAGRKLLAVDVNTIAPHERSPGNLRIFGLAPGSFYVVALTPAQMPAENSATGFAPAYYPGTTNLADARRVVVKLGETVPSIDIRTVSTRLATISGVVVDDADRPMATATLGVRQLDAGVLLPLNIERVGPEGSFRIQNLTPGEYEVRVTGTSAPPERTPLTATTRVSVNGADVGGLHLVATKIATATGRLTVDPAAAGAFTVGATRVEIVDAAESAPYQPRAVGVTAAFIVRPDLTFSATSAFTRGIAQLTSLPRGWVPQSRSSRWS